MERERARQEVRARISCKSYLQKSKSGNYDCPFCGSGTGQHRTGALHLYEDTNTWHCFACYKTGDIIDLHMIQTGADFNTALQELADSIGITIDPYRLPAAADFAEDEKPDRAGWAELNETGTGNKEPLQKEKTQQSETGGPTETPADYTEYYRACRQRITDPAALAYLEKRGISLETARAYWLGFDPAADPAQTSHPAPRLIIPTSAGHYIARRTDNNPNFAKMNPKGASPAIFNGGALYAQEVQEIFVTEGALDALSIIEAGYTAIALNSTANAQKLLDQLEEKRTDATLILCLDNDGPGKKAAVLLSEGLRRLNIPFIRANVSGEHKDPNEALTADREEFEKALAQAWNQTAAKPDNTAAYIDQFMSADIDQFKKEIKTGFPNLDRLSGGLYSGLYVLAAISSLGKTTLALQIADQLAQQGNDVIYFSLEQSKLELVSKSIARETVKQDETGRLDFSGAVGSLAIRKGYLPESVQQAAERYKEAIGDRLSIVEGNFSCNISFIGDYLRRYIARNDTRPIVFIDYLQILQPEENGIRQTTKETVDNAVTQLRRLCRELNLIVFVISSVNRANYLTPIDFESIKESGGIEYTADVIWGLQLQCLNNDVFQEERKLAMKRATIKQEKAKNPRAVELVCLKNRYGISSYNCYFDYYPANDLFTETPEMEWGTGALHISAKARAGAIRL